MLQQLALQQEYLDDATISEVCAYSVQCLCVCVRAECCVYRLVLSDSAKILEAFGIFSVKGRLFDHLEQIAYTMGIHVDWKLCWPQRCSIPKMPLVGLFN